MIRCCIMAKIHYIRFLVTCGLATGKRVYGFCHNIGLAISSVKAAWQHAMPLNCPLDPRTKVGKNYIE